MANNSQYSPVAPSRRKTPVPYGRSSSDSAQHPASMPGNRVSSAGGASTVDFKPPPVPRTQLIRSQTAAEVIHHKKAAAAVVAAAAARQQANRILVGNSSPPQGQQQQHQQNGAVVQDPRPLATPPTPLSRSFSVELPSGIRSKIPVTPVISTGPKTKPPISQHANNKSSNSSHSTLIYRHGTLVFGTASTQQKGNSVTGRLKLDLSLSPAGGRPASPGSPPSPSNPFVLHPLLADHSLLKICQAGDAGELSRYVSLLQDRVPARTVNATDASGKSGLLYGAMTGNAAVVRLLMKLPNLDINLADNEGNTALHLAAQAGQADVISLLTLSPDLKIDQRNDAGLTALMKAALQGRVRCVRLLLLAGASPVLRDFGRRLCSSEWARLTGRVKCAEIIDNYMEKMQLNPGLGYRPPGVASSEPSQLNKRPSSLSLISNGKGKDSWVKNTLRKAAKFVGASTGSSKEFSIASQLAGSGVFGASVLLPDDSARRSSLPAFERPPTVDPFQIPRIHVSYWNGPSGAGMPPPPSRAPKPIPNESRPAIRSRSRSPSPS